MPLYLLLFDFLSLTSKSYSFYCLLICRSDHEETALTRKAVQSFDSDEEAFN